MDRDAKKNAVRSKHVIDACPLDDATDEAVVASYEPAKLGAASVLPLAQKATSLSRSAISTD